MSDELDIAGNEIDGLDPVKQCLYFAKNDGGCYVAEALIHYNKVLDENKRLIEQALKHEDELANAVATERDACAAIARSRRSPIIASIIKNRGK